MIDVYYWPTANGHKVTIFLEEAGLEYRIIPINLGKGDQFAPDFLAISPNNRMPVMVDQDGSNMFAARQFAPRRLSRVSGKPASISF